MKKSNLQIKFNDFVSEIEDKKTIYAEAINRVLSSGFFILGKEVQFFEKEFQNI